MKDDVLQRFFADALIAAKHKGCGKLVATYALVGTDVGEWFRNNAKCRCDPAPTLPDGAELAALVARASAVERRSPHRARINVYV